MGTPCLQTFSGGYGVQQTSELLNGSIKSFQFSFQCRTWKERLLVVQENPDQFHQHQNAFSTLGHTEAEK